MPLTLEELRVDKKLLNPKFEGYKLSLDKIPVKSSLLPVGVHKLRDGDHFSYLYCSLFSMQNQLTVDPWNEHHLYYVDEEFYVARILVKDIDGDIENIEQLIPVPQQCHGKKIYRYHSNLLFAGPKIAVVTNGCGSLDIVNTGTRLETQKWTVEYSSHLFGDEYSFTILDARYVENGAQIKLHCLLITIGDNLEPVDTHKVSKAYSDLRYVGFNKSDNSWHLESTFQASSTGSMKYVYFSSSCDFIFIESTEPLQLPGESENVVIHEKEKKDVYYWRQSTDDIKLWFVIPNECGKNEVKIEVSDKHLRIDVKNDTFLDGEMFQRLNANLTSWSVTNNKAEVVLWKYEEGQMWNYLIENDDRGEEIIDSALVQEVHERLSHLCSNTEDKNLTGDTGPTFNLGQLEACDAVSNSDSKLVAVCLSTKKIVHEVDIRGNQKLFNLRVNSNEAPYLCLRHDVDGVLWELSGHRSELCRHVGTLNAFGFVLASKQWKYCTCSPDLSYSVISSTKQNIFIYKQDCPVSSQLKNRKTGHWYPQVGKQYLINLGAADEIVGLYASNNFLFVLTVKTIFVYRMKDLD